MGYPDFVSKWIISEEINPRIDLKVYRRNCIQMDTIQQETHTFSMDKYIYPPIKVKRE